MNTREECFVAKKHLIDTDHTPAECPAVNNELASVYLVDATVTTAEHVPEWAAQPAWDSDEEVNILVRVTKDENGNLTVGSTYASIADDSIVQRVLMGAVEMVGQSIRRNRRP